mmetsp:Transcript_136259/g.345074  ORF Transcript_136259/g.345074 Transcript_136259/m.345074 type:complete len:229 (+) Transcript_136259:439-1125(+)
MRSLNNACCFWQAAVSSTIISCNSSIRPCAACTSFARSARASPSSPSRSSNCSLVEAWRCDRVSSAHCTRQLMSFSWPRNEPTCFSIPCRAPSVCNKRCSKSSPLLPWAPVALASWLHKSAIPSWAKSTSAAVFSSTSPTNASNRESRSSNRKHRRSAFVVSCSATCCISTASRICPSLASSSGRTPAPTAATTSCNCPSKAAWISLRTLSGNRSTGGSTRATTAASC